MTNRYDLHCHSTVSDGALSPTALVQRAREQGVTHLALTDHDTTAGLAEAKVCATNVGITFINGIELSTSWQNHCIHVLGLGINTDYPPLVNSIKEIQDIRLTRSLKIAEKLEKKRITGAWEAVKAKAGDGMITRLHFADFLVSQYHVDTQQEAFDRYLGQGKSAYVATTWAEFHTTVRVIREAGGVAVLAHPLRYQLSANWLKRLLTAFKDAGGQGIEVVTGRINASEVASIAADAKRFALAGSVGSDFHNPSNQWVELGRLAPLPEDIQPIWDLL
jgi:3',5'-nucleoside bisphosphate phosphatase